MHAMRAGVRDRREWGRGENDGRLGLHRRVSRSPYPRQSRSPRLRSSSPSTVSCARRGSRRAWPTWASKIACPDCGRRNVIPPPPKPKAAKSAGGAWRASSSGCGASTRKRGSRAFAARRARIRSSAAVPNADVRHGRADRQRTEVPRLRRADGRQERRRRRSQPVRCRRSWARSTSSIRPRPPRSAMSPCLSQFATPNCTNTRGPRPSDPTAG